jgi:glycosyltransferase involved in cell wall biosynthesis
MPRISVVVPVLNESSLIAELISRVVSNLEKLTSDFEIILIDDGSEDNTWEIISKYSLIEQRIKGLKLSRNFGHHYAITAGINHTGGDWVVVMDGDLQDRPEVIPELYAKAQEGFEIVFVSRKNRPEKIYYRLAQKTFYVILRFLSGIDFDSKQANFSIISRKVVGAFNKFPENARFYGSTIKWLGFNRTLIYADHGERHSGKTSYTFKKRIKLALDIILSFSERPLKFAIGIGVFMSFSSIFISIWVLFKSLTSGFSVSGWPSIILSIFFSTGIILIVLGIIGIYIGRIFKEAKKRPLYIISDSLNV